jgi:hypothetical protein
MNGFAVWALRWTSAASNVGWDAVGWLNAALHQMATQLTRAKDRIKVNLLGTAEHLHLEYQSLVLPMGDCFWP